jgi:hypothetical protein
MNLSEGSTLNTSRRAAVARIVCVSAPVPQPTSSQREFAAGASHAMNSRAARRLHRPTKGS